MSTTPRAMQHDRASRSTAAPASRRLVIMVKEPHVGRVKTRLGREIGAVQATTFYRQTASAVILRLSRSTAWQTWLALAPDLACPSRFWPLRLRQRRQGGGDLGARMQRIMHWRGHGPILVIGTDIPAIRPHHIARAFAALGRADAVFGPTPDGGYWLVGLRRCPRVLSPFGRVRWSSAHALADTLANLDRRTVVLTTMLADVDGRDDWLRVRAWAGRRILPAPGAPGACRRKGHVELDNA